MNTVTELSTHRPAAATWRRLGKAGAAVAAVCVAGHVPLLFDQSVDPLAILVMMAMVVGCVSCASHLWSEPSPRTWRVTALMSATMLALHVFMHDHGNDMAVHGAHAHHGGVGGADSAALPQVWSWFATSSSAIQLLLALTVLMWAQAHLPTTRPRRLRHGNSVPG